MPINYKELLNEKQQEAVETIDGPLLILAGAGSGKTRVITFRIAHLLDSGIPQSSILAMTFTNKAAREMSLRIKELTKRRLSNLTISTFHAFGVSILRDHSHLIGYRPNFSIYDSNDKQDLIKEIAREMGYSRDAIDAYALTNLFSAIKTNSKSWTSFNREYKTLYEESNSHLKLYNAVDFDDLITLPIEILKNFPEVLKEYQKKFKYFMVDEFQDTSANQFEFIKLLAGFSKNICVVGDDDQSIYSWRGANYENILNFEREFPGYKEIMLDQNYRSTSKILQAANSVIKNNTNRKDKKLWTGIEKGDLIQLYLLENEKAEADLIATQIKTIKQQNKINYSDFGVLVRTNSLTRPLEEGFLRENVPYKVSGGMSFFDRKEVKDILAYLKIIANPDDDMSLLRILNVPRRGIGKKTIEIINQIAAEHKYSMFSAISAIRAAADCPVPDKMRQELDDFVTLFDIYSEKMKVPKKLAEGLKSLVEQIDYWAYLLVENKEQKVAKWKYHNVEEVIRSIGDYERDPDIINPNLQSYLHRIGIISRDDNKEDDDFKKVNLMTIHSAKGLEFNTVFITAVEENIIPHMRSLEESETNLEEERRLFYVAITRARKNLIMTSCAKRKKKGKAQESAPSSFINEIPPELLEINKEEEVVDETAAANLFQKMKFGGDESKKD